MLTKVFFTLLVVLVVALVFRHRNMARAGRAESGPQVDGSAIGSRAVVYTLLGLVVAVSALLFTLHWQDEHEIINIRVTDASGAGADYQAYKKSIDGRRFTTLDGLEVTLGDSDRMEVSADD